LVTIVSLEGGEKMADEPPEGRVHEQKNPDGSKTNYDDTGDKVKKDEKGNWVKDKSVDPTRSTTPTRPTT
jgi:hypothetical protein